MPNTFKNSTQTNVGTTPVTLYTCPASTTAIVIGLSACNLTASAIAVSVTAAGAHVRKGFTVAARSFASVLDGKIVLEASDTITLASDTAASVDVIVSIMEQT